MAVRTVGLCLGFVSHAMLSRQLGISEYGQYTILMSWCLLLVAIPKGGFDQSVLKFLPQYVASSNAASVKAMYEKAYVVVLRRAALLSLGILIATYSFPDHLGLRSIADGIMLICIVTMLALIGVFSVFFRAARFILLSQAFDQVVRQVFLILALLGFYFFQVDMSSTQALVVTALSIAITLLLLVSTLKRKVVGATLREKSAQANPEWMKVADVLFWSGLIQQVTLQVHPILIGSISTTVDVAHFSVAQRLAWIVPFALVAIETVVSPMIANAWATKQYEEIRKVATVTSRLSFAAAVLVAILLVAFGAYALQLFGTEFIEAHTTLLILLFGGLANSATAAVGPLMNMTKMQKETLWTSVVVLMSAAVSSFVLIPIMGSEGAAVSASLSMIIRSGLRAYLVWTRLGIDASVLGLHSRRSILN
jgi:O-antigen/teichoic acid export membrane protein